MDQEAGDIASRALDLGKRKAFSVMVPRGEIAWLSLDAPRQAVEQVLREAPHARYPVRDPSRQPAGYVLAREVYAQLIEGRLDLRELLREVPAFPEGATAVAVLRSLQKARSEIGLVVDESGATSGLVSIETLAEELFGEIAGEDEEVRRSIAPRDDGSFLVRGDTPIHEINRELGFRLPIEQDASTLGGLVIAAHGRFPRRGARVALGGEIHAEVMETEARRVVLVRLYARR
jgi:magnesium and cobalt transporter